MAGIDDLEEDLSAYEEIPIGGYTMEELEEYEPPRIRSVDSDFTFLEETKKGSFPSIIDDPGDLLDIFDDDEGVPDKKPVRVRKKAEPIVEDRINSEMRVFLSHYIGKGTVSAALQATKVPLVRYRKWLEKCPKFAQALVDATDTLADRLESEAFKQALSGNTKVLLKALEALRPAKWGKSSTVNSFIEGRMKVEITDWASLSRKAEEVVDVTRTLASGDE